MRWPAVGDGGLAALAGWDDVCDVPPGAWHDWLAAAGDAWGWQSGLDCGAYLWRFAGVFAALVVLAKGRYRRRFPPTNVRP